MADTDRDPVDEALWASFPASDPPAFVPVVGTGHQVITVGDTPAWPLLPPEYASIDPGHLDPAARYHLTLVRANQFFGQLAQGNAITSLEAAASIRQWAHIVGDAAPMHRREFEPSGSFGAEVRESRDWLHASIDRLVEHHRALSAETSTLIPVLDLTTASETSVPPRLLQRQIRIIHHCLEVVLTLEHNLVVRAVHEPPPALD